MNWSSLLGYPGLALAFFLSIIIVVPIMRRSLVQQNVRLDQERREADDKPREIPVVPIECGICGQINRVPETAPRALCGRCRTEIMAPGRVLG